MHFLCELTDKIGVLLIPPFGCGLWFTLIHLLFYYIYKLSPTHVLFGIFAQIVYLTQIQYPRYKVTLYIIDDAPMLANPFNPVDELFS